MLGVEIAEFAEMSVSWACGWVAPFGGKFPESEDLAKKPENPKRKAQCHISKFRTRLAGPKWESFLRALMDVLDRAIARFTGAPGALRIRAMGQVHQSWPVVALVGPDAL
ncbi:hypothetical protein Pres01_38470 [Metapseudomonas resinovorans]|nr:hypothetical protein Pres01_38470 [Pseudomonas resinovorans]